MPRPITTQTTTGTTVPGAGSSGMIPMEYRSGNFQSTIQVTITGTLTCKVQYTCDSVSPGDAVTEATATWFDHPTLTALSASAVGNIAFPVTAVRLINTAYTNGGATARILQTPVH